jgi:hypothetical protein
MGICHLRRRIPLRVKKVGPEIVIAASLAFLVWIINHPIQDQVKVVFKKSNIRNL